jgi:hypothetical protein
LCGPTQYNVIFSGAVGLYIHSHIVIIGLCRATASEYVVPYWKFVKSFNHPVCIGMRFKFHFESEDVNERRSGMIAGVSEVDPIRWPGSKWRSLLVCI